MLKHGKTIILANSEESPKSVKSEKSRAHRGKDSNDDNYFGWMGTSPIKNIWLIGIHHDFSCL